MQLILRSDIAAEGIYSFILQLASSFLSFSGLDVEGHFEELDEEEGPVHSPATFRLGEYVIEPFIRPALCCFLMSLSLIGIG